MDHRPWAVRRRLRTFGATVALFVLMLVPGVLALPAGASSRSRAARADDPSAKVVLTRINGLRRQHHLQPAVLTTSYDAIVRAAALGHRDPMLPPLINQAVEEFGIWGIAPYVPPPANAASTAIVRAWVLDDGWRGAKTTNTDCTGPTAPGCNAHRRAVLSQPPAVGATLYLDVSVNETAYEGAPGTSVAALLIWRAPSAVGGLVQGR